MTSTSYYYTYNNIEMLWSDKPYVSQKITLNSCKTASSLCILYSNSDVLSMLTYVIPYDGFPPSIIVYLIYFSYFHIHVNYSRTENAHRACNHPTWFFQVLMSFKAKHRYIFKSTRRVPRIIFIVLKHLLQLQFQFHRILAKHYVLVHLKMAFSVTVPS